MIDYVKLLVVDIDIIKLLNSKKLDFKTDLSTSTGFIRDKVRIAKIHHCSIEVHRSGTILFKGSIHKMYNSIKGVEALKSEKGFNGNDFSFQEIKYVRSYLCEIFNCVQKNMIFQNVEFGVNIQISFDPRLFIKGLLFHKGKRFEFQYNENFAQVKHSRFLIKVYNKSKQYSMSGNTIRVEVKIIKSIELKSIEIISFADINDNTLQKAVALLLKRFDEIIYYDYTIIKNNLKPLHKNLIKLFKNSLYWVDELKSNHRDRPLKILKEIIENHSKNIKNIIRLELLKKCVTINRQKNEKNCVIINHSSIM
jgi:hypothetical protein